MSNIEKKYVDYSGLQEYDGLIKGVISTDFVGATSSADGVAGRVPAPDAGDENKYLRGDGTWSPLAIATDATAGIVQPDGTTITVDGDGVISSKADDAFDSTSENSLQNKVITNIIPDKFGDAWEAKTWNGLSSLSGVYIWTDGDDIYYSAGTAQYILDKSTSTWIEKIWSGLSNFYANGRIWTDGDNIYYSNGTDQYVLNKSTSTWSAKTWNGLTDFNGGNVWTDGSNIYCSLGTGGTDQYVLNKSTSTWSVKTWSGLSAFSGSRIWTDGDNIYYSNGTDQYVLNKSTSTWSAKTWNGLTNFSGQEIWTDGNNIYYSYGADQYVLNKPTSTWKTKSWDSFSDIIGEAVWTNGDNIYYSVYTGQYALSKEKGFGTSAAKDFTDSVTSGSKAVVTSGGVYEYVEGVKEYIMFKGTTAAWTSLSPSEKAKYADGLVVLTDD